MRGKAGKEVIMEAGRKERENERWKGGWKDRRRMEKDKEKDCRIERGIKDLKKD